MIANMPRVEHKARPGQPASSDHVAPAMVRGWDQEQRKRIRGILLALTLSYDNTADMLNSPEVAVVAMIDRESA